MARGVTFLTLVNTVLVRLRESEVTTISQTAYSSLIAKFVNNTKREVEEAWNWHDLRSTFTISTVASTAAYSLTGSDERAQMLDMFRTTGTSQEELCQTSWSRMNDLYFGQTPESGQPTLFTPNGIDSNGAYTFDVYPLPDAVYTLKANAYVPQLDLSAAGDFMYAPKTPVIEGALAKAFAERGEDGGTGSLNQQMIYMNALSNAVAIDANQQPSDITWVAV